ATRLTAVSDGDTRYHGAVGQCHLADVRVLSEFVGHQSLCCLLDAFSSVYGHKKTFPERTGKVHRWAPTCEGPAEGMMSGLGSCTRSRFLRSTSPRRARFRKYCVKENRSNRQVHPCSGAGVCPPKGGFPGGII